MSFLRPYLTYATANEAPYMFHVWGAYMCLAAIVGRKLWFESDDGFLYPHLYVLYVGKAGNGKGEAMRKVKEIIRPFVDNGELHFSGNVETPEGFIRYICGNPKGNPPIESPVKRVTMSPTGFMTETTPITIFASEFVNFIAMNAEGWINLLNDIWDADLQYHYRTKGQGEDIVAGPSVNLFGALTTSSAADLRKQHIIGTGLGRRTLFQHGERQWDKPVPRRRITPERLQAKTEAIAALRQVSKMVGLMKNSDAANEWWDEWYIKNLAETPAKDLTVQSWYASKSDIMIKLAMLTAASEGRMVIEIVDYMVVLEYLAVLEKDLPLIFGGVGRNELAEVSIVIYEYVAALKEPIGFRSLKARFFSICKPPSDFENCIQYLKDSGQLKSGIMTVKSGMNFSQEEVFATPAVLAEFSQLLATTNQPAGTTPTELRLDVVDGVGQSPAPIVTPPSNQTGGPGVAESANGISNGQSQKQN